jgi:hypothetical protein
MPAILHDSNLLKVLLEVMTKFKKKGFRRTQLLRYILNAKILTTLECVIHMGVGTGKKLQDTIDLALKYEKDGDQINTLEESALFYAIASDNSKFVHPFSTKFISRLNQPSGQEKLQPLELAVSMSAGVTGCILLEAGVDLSSISGKLNETCSRLSGRKSGSIKVVALLSLCHGNIMFLNKPRGIRQWSNSAEATPVT